MSHAVTLPATMSRARAICVLLMSCTAFCVNAQIIDTRATLDAILGANRTTEDFEEFGFSPLSFSVVLSPLTTSGLVISYPTNCVLAVYGQGLEGQPSTDLSGDGTGALSVTFTSPTNAFGLDLLGFTGSGGAVIQVEVLGLNSARLYLSNTISTLDPVAPIFFGYENDAGIGGVEVIGAGEPAIIDNVTFGSTPEPHSMAMVALGLSIVGWTGLRRAGRKRERSNP